MSWVDDHCEKSPPVTMSPQWARGILHLHETCEPPCPRKLAALLRLEPESADTQRQQ
ncbi:hypothetical protein OH799_25475 [Nocardia sp. NBC_00881]|uniref:hypothetical protein n=1 Tax=Nocardia sp. NBC_00881 TaxID=2975995 RepID=UPI0038697D8A|nr:hypothetical protein OH799_25475 [Nocardia sp. NBC_00881]